ncbi:prolipoprotein diacylglyceryl transferase [Phenylobacterium sp.]|uniref:prolipoprotein diacylglyceryl transferase n=1 Tax=Phenylobacterium sp. TaxID=1871053 RepID=UPI0027316A8D|nr:prolipoprotein diacylglyceryl transferase [Phenylobacterium sp.]MDP1600468.1 prolipoprotein diacylglyceryl transferase [Phenylobacterium sp.]MDP3593250.1 prolipoprotein diacylglyceryl transferase [Phenylobacterium sp.]
MPFPDFDPVLLQIGPFAIRWYALAYVAGILVGWRYVAGLIKNQALWGPRGAPATIPQVDDLILWITLGIILGGRLGHVFFYTPSLIFTDPLEVVKVWNGGMSFHGGALGVLIAVFIFTRVNKIDVLRIGDAITAAAPIGLFFGRIANFINGELWGRPTDVPWAFVFPHAGIMPRHPSQLYEAALEGLVLFLILRWATHGAKLLQRRGVVAGIFLLGYATFRTFIENFREPDNYLPNFPLGLTMGMMLSAPMFIGGAWLIWRGLREPLATEADAPPAKPQTP